MTQYNYDGILKDDTARFIHEALQECPYVLEAKSSPSYEWFKTELKQQNLWHESDNMSGGVDRTAYVDVRHREIYKDWNDRDAGVFIFVTNQEDYDRLLAWADTTGNLVTATPFWSSF